MLFQEELYELKTLNLGIKYKNDKRNQESENLVVFMVGV